MKKRKKKKAFNPHYLEAVQALARMTYKSIYIVDHQNKVFDYVSDNPLFCCGYSPQEVQKMGFDFYTHCIPNQERDLLVQVTKAGFSFFSSIPIKERKQYTLSFDIHLKHRLTHTFLIHQEMTPLCLKKTGELWKSICIVSLSTAHQAGNSTIFKRGSEHIWVYHSKQKTWEMRTKPKLSPRELEVLQYSIRGYAILEIASLLCLTADTIKFHRKKILEKLQVKTTAEAIRFAIVHKLI
ncbi:helix-turn-helix transcriptional regulator [Myroides fluvii]|uniref:helix-turn-helix transcriptional regulator n=1 Tax=Myroides fluvii TaxID=2572594 RepID=UPI001E656AC5|nr:LuxR family transcriptional regulator [Myroides fluvii]